MRRVRPILQMEATECGAACLAMLLNYHGRPTSLAEVRERCGVGRDGLTGATIARVARGYGLRVQGFSLPAAEFERLTLPAIAHWDCKHFVVVERLGRDSVEVVDPAAGRRGLSPAEFEAKFTGVAITATPGPEFSRAGTPRTRWRALWPMLSTLWAPAMAVQLFVASLVLQAFGLALPFATGYLIDTVIAEQMQGLMVRMAVGIALVGLGHALTLLLRSFLLVTLHARMEAGLSLEFLTKLVQLPYRFFQQRSTGDLFEKFVCTAAIRDAFGHQLLGAVLDGLLVMTYLGVLLWRSPRFALAVSLIGLVQVAVVVLTSRRVGERQREVLDARARSTDHLSEVICGIATLKASGAEDRAVRRWSELFAAQLAASVRKDRLQAWVESALGTLRLLAPLLLLWLGAGEVLAGRMTVGMMLSLNALGLGCLAPLSSLSDVWQQVTGLGANVDRIADVATAQPERDLFGSVQPPPLQGRIELSDVSFCYDGAARSTLHHIDAVIEAGQKVAIVGRTGSGKSTLARLLLGLHLPTEGEILYDRRPLRSLDVQALRRQIGVVLQDAYIFNGSVRQNVAFADPTMPTERIVAAATAAGLHEDIRAMPMGYETVVADAGSALSGGQRQRLALARALAGAPPIILLDEATSHLDVITERIIDENLKSLKCTRIVIAHRLSTVIDADVIWVMHDGALVEQGTHETLLRDGTYYRQLMAQHAPRRPTAGSRSVCPAV